MSEPILACYKDDGLSQLLSLLHSSNWKRELAETFPPPGFVGQGSISFRDIVLRHYRIASIHLRPIRGTSSAPLWRLTFVLETSLRPLLTPLSGLA